MKTGCLIAILLLVIIATIEARSIKKRQTYYYPEEFRKYAHTHPGTKVIHGTVGRFAPQDWPAWYTRTIFRWNGESRISPYHPNDVRYAAYEQSRIQNTNAHYIPIEKSRKRV